MDFPDQQLKSGAIIPGTEAFVANCMAHLVSITSPSGLKIT